MEGEERTPFLVRLSGSDRRRLEKVREHEGLNSVSDAVRHAIRFRYERLEPFPD